MMSVAVSKLGKTAPFFVGPEAKVNSAYHCDEVLARGLLSGVNDYVFQFSSYSWLDLNANVPEFIESEN